MFPRWRRRRRRRGGGGGDLFVFNDTIEGPRAPAVKPGIGGEEEVLFVFNDTIERLSQGASLKRRRRIYS